MFKLTIMRFLLVPAAGNAWRPSRKQVKVCVADVLPTRSIIPVVMVFPAALAELVLLNPAIRR